jgi:hypothetical protein
MQGNSPAHPLPSYHCLDSEVNGRNRHYNVCKHVDLHAHQRLHHIPKDNVLVRADTYTTTTMVECTCTMVGARVQITLSQKRLEIQALRCNEETRERCQHRRQHGVQRFQLDSEVCRADLYHNPRKHMWACTHTSACIASLRTVSVVVRVCGFHGWSSWLGTCSPGRLRVNLSTIYAVDPCHGLLCRRRWKRVTKEARQHVRQASDSAGTR